MKKNRACRAVRALLSLRKRKSWGPFVEAFETSKFDHSFSISWSQAGEDLSLLAILTKIERGRYLDIGAHHPTRFSVTRHLFQRGWTGVNVDGNSDLIGAFLQSRPLDISLNYCVGNEKDYQLSVFDETAISTVNASWVEKFVEEDNVKNTVRTVPGITLRELLDTYFPTKGPDFFNVDIEGADYEAISSGGLNLLPQIRKPAWILVETNAPLSRTLKTDTVQLLVTWGYEVWLVLPFACLLKISEN